MTWGKGGSTNVVQVTTKSRRAASVPAADVEYEPSVGSKTARAVYSAMNDANEMLLASRRHDQKLLNDIQMRMENAAFSKPSRRESRSRARRWRQRRTSVPSFLSASARDIDVDDDKFEIVLPESVSAKSLAPCARRAYHRGYLQRSASLPPSIDDSASVRPSSGRRTAVGGSGEFISLGSPLLRLVDVSPAPVKPKHGRQSLFYSTWYLADVDADRPPKKPKAAVASADVAVADWWWPPYGWLPSVARRRHSFAFEDANLFRRHYDYTPQLNLASAYHVTYPRPYVRRHTPLSLPTRHYNIYRYEGDYMPKPITSSFRASSEPRKFLPTASLAVRQAKNSLNRIERELGMGSVSLDNGPYIDEPVVRTTHILPTTAVRTGWVRNSPRVARRTSYNYSVTSSRPPPVPRSTRQHEIEARLETMLVPETVIYPVSLSSLRTRTTEARNKMDRHKVLIDRYLPIPTGTPNEVPYEVEYKFSELAERMPQLRPREPINRASSLPPPASPVTNSSSRPTISQYNDALRRTPFRPAMSETRKRAREVLCRTKGDPHYFDY